MSRSWSLTRGLQIILVSLVLLSQLPVANMYGISQNFVRDYSHPTKIKNAADSLFTCPSCASFASCHKSKLSAIVTGTETFETSDLSRLSHVSYESPARILMDKLTSALRAETGGLHTLDAILHDELKYTSNSPIGITGKQDFLEAIEKFAGFFIDPRVLLISADQKQDNIVKINCQFSFEYPLPWRPRIIIPIEATVTFSDYSPSDRRIRIVSIKEAWKESAMTIFLQQVLPRWWDAWHVFSSPSPEFPPIKTNIEPKQNGVTFSELSESLYIEVTWEAPTIYPGPPILSLPSFSLFGDLATSKLGREKFSTSMPPEIQSSRFTCSTTKKPMKRTRWIFHIPTSLQHLFMANETQQLQIRQDKCPLISLDEYNQELAALDAQSDSDNIIDGIPDDITESDYQVGYENLNLMKGVSQGMSRGIEKLDREYFGKYILAQKKFYRVRLLPKRKIASVAVKGEVKKETISQSLVMIKKALSNSRWVQVDNKDEKECFNLHLENTKVCFSPRGEPSMSIYEMQYKDRITNIFVELTEK